MQFVAEKDEAKNLRIRLPDGLKAPWQAMLRRKKISQQDAIVALVDLVLRQKDDVIQSMLLGQTRPTDELMKILVRQIAVTEEFDLSAAFRDHSGQTTRQTPGAASAARQAHRR